MREQGKPITGNLGVLLILYLVGCGVSLSNTIEAGKALLTNRSFGFQRTPKYAHLRAKDEWRKLTYQVSFDGTWALELAAVCLGIAAVSFAVWRASYATLLILIPYTAAYAFVCLLTVRQSRRAEAA
jgi:hypothetical protein